jgi:hypothetical protein
MVSVTFVCNMEDVPQKEGTTRNKCSNSFGKAETHCKACLLGDPHTLKMPEKEQENYFYLCIYIPRCCFSFRTVVSLQPNGAVTSA